jgi:glycosyltransferase involved in cell wall biosynthesis
MLDVLYVIGQFGRGGSERQLALLASHLAHTGKKVAIAVLSAHPPDAASPAYPTPGVPVVRPDHRLGRPGVLWEIVKFAAVNRPRVVHCFTFWLNFYAHALGLISRAATLGGARSGFDRMRQETPELMWRLCLRYPGIIAFNNSAAARRVAALRRPWAPRTTLVVPNAIDLERFPKPVRHGARDSIRIIGVGNLRDEKRWHLAIDAVCSLRARGVDCRLRILGSGSLRAELERRIDAVGARQFVELLGNVEGVEGHLTESDVLLHTSGSEGSPNAVTEGMAAGLACVATGVGEVPILLGDGARGLVVGPDDQPALVTALERVCRDPRLRETLGTAARKHTETALSVNVCAAEWERIYGALLCGQDLGKPVL